MNEEKRLFEEQMKQLRYLKLVLDRAEQLIPIVPRLQIVDSILKRTDFKWDTINWETLFQFDDEDFCVVMHLLYNESADFWKDLEEKVNKEVV